jgi:hypothetical protein
MDNTWDGFYAG